jgi:hypothetical protein
MAMIVIVATATATATGQCGGARHGGLDETAAEHPRHHHHHHIHLHHPHQQQQRRRQQQRERVCAWAIGVARWLADGQTADRTAPERLHCETTLRPSGPPLLVAHGTGRQESSCHTSTHPWRGPLSQPCEPTKAFRVPCLVCGVACAAAVIGSRHVSAWLPRHTMP